MFIRELYRLESPFREDMTVKGFTFGRGEKAACIVGPLRGNEIQQLYICSQLMRRLKELEANGCISAGKEIMVVPGVNLYSLNVGTKFWGMERTDINRFFPGNNFASTTTRIADGILQQIKDYNFGIQLASFYMTGEFIPHVRMMETGYQNTSLANLFGLPYVVVRKPRPIDTRTLNYNWQNENTAAFSIYTNKNQEIDDKSARQAVAAMLRFLMRMGIIRYESHSGYISHVILEEDLMNVHASHGGILVREVATGEEVRYGMYLASVIDPLEGNVKEIIKAPTDGIVFFSNTEALVGERDIVFRLIHRLHE